ncbi:hypothetical protein SAMN05216298_1729 [Glycomyces sambucus]|uniref:Uncharacterized protein n=1 Tax=Glycomyces sambucus TaxID=380244 RepID=A0A1G9FDW0_9ACTN|nr:hypothetical protein [Glycomyces sambucus]SDK86605.1 hypothetical protein SAMN05216298_1729 [Glycomyces sambucus]
MTAWLAYDSRLSRTLLGAFWWFATSVQLLATALPFAAVDHAIGLSHLGIWLGALAAVPAGPGLYAALKCMRDFAADGYPGRPFATFWIAWLDGWRRLRRVWTGAAALGLLLAYDAVLYGTGDAAFTAITAAALLGLAALIAVASAVLAGAEGPALAVLTAALKAMVLRPQAPVAWLALAALAYGSAQLPVVGPNLALFTPAACAFAILIVNAATGFDRRAAA